MNLVDADNYKEALHLAQLYRYPPLVIYVLRKQNLYSYFYYFFIFSKFFYFFRIEDLLRYLLKEGDINDVVEYCGQDAYDINFY